MAENNNFITRNLRQNGALPYKTAIKEGLLNNELLADGYLGVQGAVREIFHRGMASACIITESTTGNLAPSGTYDNCNVASGYILTKNSNGLSRLVLCAAATALNIAAVTDCVVASNDGTVTVKAKTSVLSTDVIIATRSPGDNVLVDVRNIKTEDDVLAPNLCASSMRVVGNTQVYMVGVDIAGKRTIVLKDGDDLSDAVTALGGAGTLVLLPGTYTDSVTLSYGISIIGMYNPTIVGTITINSSSKCTLQGISITGSVSIENVDSVVDIIDCVISNSGDCIDLTGNATAAFRVRVMKTDLTTSGSGTHCIHRASGTSNAVSLLMVSRCTLTAATGNGIYLYSVGKLVVQGTYINAARCCIYESNGINDLMVSDCIMTPSDSTYGRGVSLATSTLVGTAIVQGTSIVGTFQDGINLDRNLPGNSLIVGCAVINAYSSFQCSDSMINAHSAIGCIFSAATDKFVKVVRAFGVGCRVGTDSGTPFDTGIYKRHANYENGTYAHGDTT